MEYLSVDDLVEVHPDAAPAVRDYGLLELAASRPSSGFGDVEFFPGVHDKAAALLHGIAHLHPFVDGNKRTAWLAAAVFLALNGWLVESAEDAAFDLVVGVAEHRIDVPEVAAWLRGHSSPTHRRRDATDR